MATDPPVPPTEPPPPPGPVPPSPLPGYTSPASTLPTPMGAPVAPLPPSRRGRGRRTTWIVVAIVVVIVVIGAVVAALARSNSRFNIDSNSASSDGTFHGGDCVTLSTTQVHSAACTSTHDGQIIKVIHGSDTCPAGTDIFKVQDGTGDLCIDKGNSKS